jgi:hypothetical protein
MTLHVTPPPAIDLLTQAIEYIRPYLAQSLPIGERARNFWAGVVAARDYGAVDVVEQDFLDLAQQTGLTGDLSDDDVKHLIRSAFLDLNPFC